MSKKADAWRRQARQCRDAAQWLSLHHERRQLLAEAADLEGRADTDEREADEAAATAARRKPDPDA